MEVRFTFSADVYIKADSLQEARDKFLEMRLLSDEANEHGGDLWETVEEEIQSED